MSESPALIYLEADDEITAVVRRVRAADAGRVVIVAPGRSRATSSAVALRLLARAGEEGERELANVGDALTRSLAAEAGLAAFATVEEARRAEPGAAAPAAESRHAAIHVVRGPAMEDTVTAPVLAADDDLTRPVPVTRPSLPAPRPRRRLRRTAAAGVLALVAALLVGLVAGAAMLPAATITLAPRGEDVGPMPDVIAIAGVERLSGTVTEVATVTATGAYEILRPATGTVLLYNWSGFPQAVAAGIFVAAGEQAFEIQEDVVVPRGQLTPQGRIQAGSIEVAVEAAAPGPAANVQAGAINQILDADTDARLQLFPENPERRVENVQPTSGGRDESGPEITEDDVQGASRALTRALRGAADEAMAASDSLLFADPAEPVEPIIEGLDDLIGRRDTETVEIRGSLTYDRLTADPAQVEASAIDGFVADLPTGSQLIEGSTRVEFGEVLRAGEGVSVKVTVSGRVSPIIERDEVLDRIIGLTPDEARAALADVGEATVELWPGWVATVPETVWRIDLRVVEP